MDNAAGVRSCCLRSDPVGQYAMIDDEALRAKLAKVEALFRRAGSPGERAAAEAAMGRLQDRLGGSGRRRAEPEVVRGRGLSAPVNA